MQKPHQPGNNKSTSNLHGKMKKKAYWGLLKKRVKKNFQHFFQQLVVYIPKKTNFAVSKMRLKKKDSNN